MYVCLCFGVTEQQVRDHAAAGACTPREIASRCRAGTDCGSCVRRIQGLLGRGGCARREAASRAVTAAESLSALGAAPDAAAADALPVVAGCPPRRDAVRSPAARSAAPGTAVPPASR